MKITVAFVVTAMAGVALIQAAPTPVALMLQRDEYDLDARTPMNLDVAEKLPTKLSLATEDATKLDPEFVSQLDSVASPRLARSNAMPPFASLTRVDAMQKESLYHKDPARLTTETWSEADSRHKAATAVTEATSIFTSPVSYVRALRNEHEEKKALDIANDNMFQRSARVHKEDYPGDAVPKIKPSGASIKTLKLLEKLEATSGLKFPKVPNTPME